jgi:thiamine biosynthesis lipoprotein ApbE
MDISDSVRRTQPLLGTFVEIAAAGADRDDLQQAIDEAFAAVAQVHRLMSFHDPHGDVSRLNREASTRTVPVHAWTYQVLEMAIELHRQSAGVFDVTVAPLLQHCFLATPTIPRRLWTSRRLKRRSSCSATPAFAISVPQQGSISGASPRALPSTARSTFCASTA